MVKARLWAASMGERLKGLLQHDDVIVSVCERNGMDPDLVRALLALESSFPNLHGYGMRPALRREMARIIDTRIPGDRAGG